MTATDQSYTGPPTILHHDLNRHFPELLKFGSTPEMESSALWGEIRPDVERVLNAVVVECLSVPEAVARGHFTLPTARHSTGQNTPVATAPRTDTVKAIAWNLERGI